MEKTQMILKKGSVFKELTNQFQSLATINIHNTLSKKELSHITNVLLSQNTRLRNDKNIYYCLLVGHRSLIQQIIDEMDGIYYSNWIDEYYCMLTYTPTYDTDIPRANVVKILNGVEMSLYGYKILYIPQIIQLKSFISLLKLLRIDANEFDIMFSVNTNNIDNEDTDHPGWCHFMDHSIGSPGLHYFINMKNPNLFSVHDVLFDNCSYNNFSTFIIQTPDQRIELEDCLSL